MTIRTIHHSMMIRGLLPRVSARAAARDPARILNTKPRPSHAAPMGMMTSTGNFGKLSAVEKR